MSDSSTSCCSSSQPVAASHNPQPQPSARALAMIRAFARSYHASPRFPYAGMALN